MVDVPNCFKDNGGEMQKKFFGFVITYIVSYEICLLNDTYNDQPKKFINQA